MSEPADSGYATPGSEVGDLVPGRSCKDCTLCCKLLAVEPLQKPRAAWCPHCDQKRGCGIYETRPEACRMFYCGYRRLPQLDERWKPAKAKFLVNYESARRRIVIHVDPARPDAWRAEPFYARIRQWARSAAAEGGTVLVWTGANVTVVLPDAEKDLGAVGEDKIIVPVERATPRGRVLDVMVLDPDDPRVPR